MVGGGVELLVVARVSGWAAEGRAREPAGWLHRVNGQKLSDCSIQHGSRAADGPARS